MRFTIIALLASAVLIAGCGSPIHSVYTQSTESAGIAQDQLVKAREQQLLAEEPDLAKLDRWDSLPYTLLTSVSACGYARPHSDG